MDEKKQYVEPQEEEEKSGVDFGELFAALLRHKMLYCKVLIIALVLACVYTLSLPNTYSCEVLLAPELSTTRTTNSLSAMAAQFGMKMGKTTMGNTEALYPALYPDLMNSTDFKVSLFNVPVHKKDSTRMMTYYDYLKNEQKMPWWSTVMSGAREFLASFRETKKDTIDQSVIDLFQLTKEQTAIIKSLNKKVVCDVDDKTMVISITVTDQDPLVCATMADSVQARLQNFITEYRTKKARVDYEYCQKLYDDAKLRYDQARERYAIFADANKDMILQSARTELINLENEMQLQYNNFNSVALQLMAAEAKVQEDTPSFTTLQRATVPLKKSGPSRSKIVLICLFLALVGTSAWILYKEDQIKPLLGLS